MSKLTPFSNTKLWTGVLATAKMSGDSQVKRKENTMFHGSSEIVEWAVSPFEFLFDWVSWPFKVVSSHF